MVYCKSNNHTKCKKKFAAVGAINSVHVSNIYVASQYKSGLAFRVVTIFQAKGDSSVAPKSSS